MMQHRALALVVAVSAFVVVVVGAVPADACAGYIERLPPPVQTATRAEVIALLDEGQRALENGDLRAAADASALARKKLLEVGVYEAQAAVVSGLGGLVGAPRLEQALLDRALVVGAAATVFSSGAVAVDDNANVYEASGKDAAVVLAMTRQRLIELNARHADAFAVELAAVAAVAVFEAAGDTRGDAVAALLALHKRGEVVMPQSLAVVADVADGAVAERARKLCLARAARADMCEAPGVILSLKD